MSLSFKIFFSESNIRRIHVEDKPTYREFTVLLQRLYPEDYHPELFLKWQDEEGDKITVSSEPEWQHLLESSPQQQPIKLFVNEGADAPLYFKDGPPAEPQYFYKENKEEINEQPELLDRLKQSIPECLKHLFEGNKILPYDLPFEWLADSISVKRLKEFGNEVDLDIDIPKLFQAMHKRALQLLSDANNLPLIQQAKALLLDMLNIVPQHAVTLYNLACAESLLGNKVEAIKALFAAVHEGGYSNGEHMVKDSDLTNIRDTPEFQQLVQSLQNKNEIPQAMETEAKETEAKEEILQDWTRVEEEAIPINNPPAVENHQQLSVGEIKWKNQIEQLRGMGFGQGEQYFGPKCVALLERRQGNIDFVIGDLLQE